MFPDGKTELEPKLALKSEANKIQRRSQRQRSVNQIQSQSWSRQVLTVREQKKKCPVPEEHQAARQGSRV